jgi:hypothetical protein
MSILSLIANDPNIDPAFRRGVAMLLDSTSLTRPKLLPCPYCGAPAHASEDDHETLVSCSNKGCCAFTMCASPEQWNGRV